MALTQAQIFEKLQRTDESLSKKQVKTLLSNFAELAYKEAKNGFPVPGLGKLVLVKRKARLGRNPATGESIKIPAKTVLKFRISKTAKDAVLGVQKKVKKPAANAKKISRKK
ncbi:MAG: HU family DNA-binding protein [Chitinivibrionales bacterium]|nr:HU family DNA-binding protein [Chitinivibrionales bacterium]